MSNSNTNLQTQSSNALHNAIRKRELIHHCLQNPPYTYQWAEKTVPVAEGSSETTTESDVLSRMHVKLWKAIERLKQGASINVQGSVKPIIIGDCGNSLHGMEIDPKFMALNLTRQANLQTNQQQPSNYYKTPVELIKIILQESTEEQCMKSEALMLLGLGKCSWGSVECRNQPNWKDYTDDESRRTEFEAHNITVATDSRVTQIQLTI
ncbi:hypothetical protein Tco_1514991 [Tanacetum coccineum]